LAQVKMLITFMDNSLDFTAKFSSPPSGDNPTEAQFEIAGRELIAIADTLRNARLSGQIKTSVGGTVPTDQADGTM